MYLSLWFVIGIIECWKGGVHIVQNKCVKWSDSWVFVKVIKGDKRSKMQDKRVYLQVFIGSSNGWWRNKSVQNISDKWIDAICTWYWAQGMYKWSWGLG